jgi:sugar phosphate isomerase/epimerase
VIEPYVNNVIGSCQEALRLFADVGEGNLGLAMDPANYFEVHNIRSMDETINGVFDALSRHIKFAHAKDVRPIEYERGVQMTAVTATEGHALRGVGPIELPAPGLGVLNYELYLQRLGRDHPNLPIIIEHVDEEEIPRAKAFLDEKLIAAGV